MIRPSYFAGTEILVPLTQSMYVPGRIADAGKVLIDIGTGYFVEKSIPKAKEYLDRRVRNQLSHIAHENDQIPVYIHTAILTSYSMCIAPLRPQVTMVTQNVDSLQKVLLQKEQTTRMVSGYMQRRLAMLSDKDGRPSA